MTTPGGAGTLCMRTDNFLRARRIGLYHGVGAPTAPSPGAPALRFAPPRYPKPSLALTPAVLALCPLTQMAESEFQASGLAGALVNRGGAMRCYKQAAELGRTIFLSTTL